MFVVVQKYGAWVIATDDPIAEGWQRILVQLVQWAFEERPVSLITIQPQAWSWDRRGKENGSSGLESKIADVPVSAVGLNKLTASLIEDICLEEDFRRGLLWLVGERIDLLSFMSLSSLVDDGTADLKCPDCIEVIRMETDGRELIWCNPRRTSSEILEFLTRTT